MPIIQVNLLEGRSAEQKRKFAADVTKAACEDLKAPADHVWVQFIEMSKENFASDGVLAADK